MACFTFLGNATLDRTGGSELQICLTSQVLAELLATVIGFAALPGVACFAQRGSQRAERQDCLLVAEFATEVKYAEFQGRDQLTYTVQESYPATDVLAFISDSLREKHWKPLRYDLWNPKIPSSHVSGWTGFDDTTVMPHQKVYQWMAQWENDKHDVVCYALQYRYPKQHTNLEPEQDMQTLHVTAICIPAKIAAQVKSKQQ
jgi:hypothetical protein